MLSLSSVQSLLCHLSSLREWTAQGPTDINAPKIAGAISAFRIEAREAGLGDILQPFASFPPKSGSRQEVETVFQAILPLFQELEDRFDTGLLIYREPLSRQEKLPLMTRQTADRLQVPALLLIARAFKSLSPELGLQMLDTWGLSLKERAQFLASLNFEGDTVLFRRWIEETHHFWRDRPLLTPSALQDRREEAVAFWKERDTRVYALNHIYGQKGGGAFLAELMEWEMRLCLEAVSRLSALEKTQILRFNEHDKEWEPVLALLHLECILSIVDAICPEELETENDLVRKFEVFLRNLKKIDYEDAPFANNIAVSIASRFVQVLRIYSPQEETESEEKPTSTPSPSAEVIFGHNEDVFLRYGTPQQRQKAVEMLTRQLHGVYQRNWKKPHGKSAPEHGLLTLFVEIQEEVYAEEHKLPDPKKFHTDVIDSGVLRAAGILLRYGGPPHFEEASLRDGTLQTLRRSWEDPSRPRGGSFYVAVVKLLIEHGLPEEVPALCKSLIRWGRDIARKQSEAALDILTLLQDRPERDQYEKDIESCLKILLNDPNIKPLPLLGAVRYALKLRSPRFQADIEAALKRLVFVGECHEERLAIAMEAASLWDDYDPDWDRAILQELKTSSAEWLTAAT